LEFLSDKPYSTARRYLISGVVWGVIGTLVGLTAAAELVAPDLIGPVRYLSFGRIRPLHVNAVAFGFVYTLLLGTTAYIVPRLCRVEGLWSERLGCLSAWVWNAIFVGAVLTLPFGMTQGREWAELVYGLDVLFMLGLGLYSAAIYMTILRRREPLLYVSLWYVGGGLIWTLSIYFLGNVMFRPPSGSLTGIVDPIWNWFYGHTIVGLILTPVALAAAYWVIPRAIGAPIWNHTMSLIGFWVLLVIYTHTGTHHLLQAPVPRWLKVIAVVDSVMLAIPVMAVLLNLWLPMRGRWSALHNDVGAKFVFAGTIWYLIVCFQGPLQSLPSVQRLTHFTHWVIGHAHIAVLGFSGFIGIGAMYAILPDVTGKPLYSRRLADFQYWAMLVGLTLMFLVLTGAGLVQGEGWLNGEAFYRVVPRMKVYMILRAVSGIAIISGMIVMALNVYLTLRQPPARPPGAETSETPPAETEARP
jgi:cbb3-type cytochrome c oxidase subunit I